MAPKFKIGDKVRILPRQGSSEDYRSAYVDEMLKYVGRTATIKWCNITDLIAGKWPDDGYVYMLEEFGFGWNWNSSMLELVENSDSKEEEYIHPSKLKDGDFIRIRTGNYKGLIYIFKEYKDNNIYRYVSLDLNDSELNTNSSVGWGTFTSNDKITYATEEERKLLLEALAKEGYYWDFGANTLTPIETITLAKSISVDTVQPITNPYKTPINLFNPNSKQEDFNELNLFPTKKHYQLNFNY